MSFPDDVCVFDSNGISLLRDHSALKAVYHPEHKPTDGNYIVVENGLVRVAFKMDEGASDLLFYYPAPLGYVSTENALYDESWKAALGHTAGTQFFAHLNDKGVLNPAATHQRTLGIVHMTRDEVVVRRRDTLPTINAFCEYDVIVRRGSPVVEVRTLNKNTPSSTFGYKLVQHAGTVGLHRQTKILSLVDNTTWNTPGDSMIESAISIYKDCVVIGAQQDATNLIGISDSSTRLSFYPRDGAVYLGFLTWYTTTLDAENYDAALLRQTEETFKYEGSVPIVGTELLTNNGFDTDLSGWSQSAGTWTRSTTAPKFSTACVTTSSVNARLNQAVTLTAGTTYAITGWIDTRDVTVGSASLRLNDAALAQLVISDQVQAGTTWSYATILYTPTSTATYNVCLQTISGSFAGTARFDGISVIAMPSSFDTQSTSPWDLSIAVPTYGQGSLSVSDGIWGSALGITCTSGYIWADTNFSSQDWSGYSHLSFWVNPGSQTRIDVAIHTTTTGGPKAVWTSVGGGLRANSWQLVTIALASPTSTNIGGTFDLRNVRNLRIGDAYSSSAGSVQAGNTVKIDHITLSNFSRGIGTSHGTISKFEESGLTHWYRFDESNGTTTLVDSSGNAKNATRSTDPWFRRSHNASGQSWGFDGENDWAINTTDTTVPGTWTMSAWVYMNSLSGHRTNGTGLMIAVSYTGSVIMGFDDGKAYLNVKDNGNVERSIIESTTRSTNTWYHLAATHNGTTARLYVNGAEVGTVACDITGAVHNGKLVLGSWAFNNLDTYYLDGYLEDVRVYNRTLTATEITALYGLTTPDLDLKNANGLVAFWPFQESSGTTAADVTALVGSGTFTRIPGTAGKYGNAAWFDGNSTFATIPNAADIKGVGTALTISAWVYPARVTGATQRIVSLEGVYFLALNSTNKLYAGTWNTVPQFAAVTSVATIASNTWTHVAMTYDGSNLRAYINGALDATSARTGTVNSGSAYPLTIGAYNDGASSTSECFNGGIDDVRVYNRVLSTTEITALYGMTAVYDNLTTSSSLRAAWGLGEAAGSTTFADDVEGGNALTYSPVGISTEVKKFGTGSIRFDGWDDYIDLSTALLRDMTGTKSIAAWVYPVSYDNGAIAITCNSVDSVDGWGFELRSSGAIRYIIRNGTVQSVTSTTLPIVLNSWQHVAMTYDGSTHAVALYHNGAAQATTGTITQLAGVGPFSRIGSEGDSINNLASDIAFNGYMDDIRVWNRVLSATEVTNLAAWTSHLDSYTPSVSGLQAYFDIAESTGMPSSRVSGPSTATEVTSPWWAGKYTNAVRLDGHNSYVNIPHNATLKPNAFTVAFWIKQHAALDDTAGNDYRTLFNTVGGQAPFGLYLETSNQINFTVTHNATEYRCVGSNSAFSGETLTVGVWAHLAYAYDPVTGTGYAWKDGALSRSGLMYVFGGAAITATGSTPWNPTTNTSDWRVGDYAGANRAPPASIDDLRLFNAVLTTTQVAALSGASAPVDGVQPAIWYPFDSQSLSVVTDRIGATSGAINSVVESFDESSQSGSVFGVIAGTASDHVRQQYTVTSVETNATIKLTAYLYRDSAAVAGNVNFYFGTSATLDGSQSLASIPVTDLSTVAAAAHTITIPNITTSITTYYVFLKYTGTDGNMYIQDSTNGSNYTSKIYNATNSTYGATKGNDGRWNLAIHKNPANQIVSGKYGNAISLNSGSGNQHVDLGSPAALDINGNISIAFWFNPDTSNVAGADVIIGDKVNRDGSWSVIYNATANRVEGFMNLSGSVKNRVSTSVITRGAWNHVVWVLNGTTPTVYVNGVVAQDASFGSSAHARSYGGITIGGAVGVNGSFHGIIDDVRVYNRALTSTDVTSLYHSADTNLVYYLPFDESSGTTYANRAHNGLTNATFTDGVTANYREGKWGNGLRASGANWYNVANVPALGTAWTLSAWVKPLLFSGTHIFLSRSLPYLAYGADGIPFVSWNDSGSVQRTLSASGGAMTLSTWYHVIATHTGTTTKIFVNGTLYNTNSTNDSISVTTSTWCIGNHTDGAQTYTSECIIDEVRLYNRALTDAEVGYLYNYVPMTSGGILFYQCNDSVTNGNFTVSDMIGSNTGTWTSVSNQTIAGQYGNAMVFGGNDYLRDDSPNSRLDVSSTMTFMAWVNPKAITTAGMRKTIFMNLTGAGAGAKGIKLALDPSGVVAMEVGTTSGFEALATASSTYTANAWYHIAGYINGTAIRIYVNGVQAASGTLSGAVNTGAAGTFHLGSHGLFEYFDGTIDDVRIYNVAIDAADVDRISKVGLHGRLRYYGFNEATSATSYASGIPLYTAQAATYTNQNSPTWTNASTKFGNQAIVLGGNSYVQVADHSTLSFTNNIFSLSFWMRANQNVDNMGVLTKGGVASGGADWEYSAWTTSGSLFFGTWTSAGTSVYPNVSTSFSVGPWQHFCVTADATTLTLYKDGVSVSTSTKSANSMSNTTGPFHIGHGGSSAASGYFNGQLAHVNVWSRCLTAAEVDTLSKLGCFGKRFAYVMDGTSGTTTPNLGDDTANASNLITWGENTSYATANYFETGKSVNALRIGRTSRYRSASALTVNVNTWTLSAWVKLDSTAYTNCPLANQSGLLYLAVLSPGIPRVSWYDSGLVQRYLAATSTLSTGTWYHLAASHDGTTAKMYVNGILEASTADYTSATVTTFDAMLGSFNASYPRTEVDGYTFDGLLDDVRMYTRALASDEVAELARHPGWVAGWSATNGVINLTTDAIDGTRSLSTTEAADMVYTFRHPEDLTKMKKLSIWMKMASSTVNVAPTLVDSSGYTLVGTSKALTTSWANYTWDMAADFTTGDISSFRMDRVVKIRFYMGGTAGLTKYLDTLTLTGSALGTGTWVPTTESAASGGVSMVNSAPVNGTDFLQYDIVAPIAGMYRIAFRSKSAADNTFSDAWTVTLNGVTQTFTTAAGTKTSYDGYTWKLSNPVMLDGTDQVLKFTVADSNPHAFDCFVLMPLWNTHQTPVVNEFPYNVLLESLNGVRVSRDVLSLEVA